MDKDLRKEELNKIKEQKKDEKIKAKALEDQRIRVHNAMNAYEKKHKRERKIAPK